MNINVQILILTNKYESTLNEICVLNQEGELIDDVTIKFNNGNIYTFDYLIFTNPSYLNNFRDTNILHDGGIPVTNFYHQTTYENIYYVEQDKINDVVTSIFNEEE